MANIHTHEARMTWEELRAIPEVSEAQKKLTKTVIAII